MEVAIVKYNAGNVVSVVNALKRVGVDPVLTDDEKVLRGADRVIFPGVGEASTTMAYLREHRLDSLIISLKRPVLGICIGMQLMCRHSEEGDVDCLGIFDTDVRRFPQAMLEEGSRLKVPQMGWNTIHHLRGPLFDASTEGKYVYYVHGYYAERCGQTVAESDYGLTYSAALQKDNFYAVQFHPEKSALVGEEILRRFIDM